MRGIAMWAFCYAISLKSGVFPGKQHPQKVLTDGGRHKQMKTLRQTFASHSLLPLSLRWRLLYLPFLTKTFPRDHVVS